MSIPHDVSFSIVLRSPFIMAGMDASGAGIDTPALRDEFGKPILPGDHLKGLLREALARLEAVNSPLLAVSGGRTLKIEALFGAQAVAASGRQAPEPVRGRLRLSDLIADVAPSSTDITRIEIDDHAGTVKTGALQVVELVAPLNQTVTFSGTSLFYGTADEAATLEKLLKTGLCMIAAFGGVRTAGFGEHVTEQSTVTVTARPAARKHWPAGQTRAVLTGRFNRAFMVNVSQAADNVYVGGTVVPGAAIKGALADMLIQAGYAPADMSTPLGRALAKLHISHAHPIKDQSEHELPVPLSIMRQETDRERLVCALGAASPGLIGGACVDFQPDWKPAHEDAARVRCGRGESQIPQLMRGHTAISSQTGVAEDQKLFLEVLRARIDNEGADVSYRFTVDTTESEKVDAASARLFREMLGSELTGVGKTHATLSIDSAAVAPETAQIATPGPWRVLLETPAVMLDPEAEGGFDTYEEAVRAYFRHVIPEATVEDYYVRRDLVGGHGASRTTWQGYRPVSLFRKGSCFLLSASPTEAKTVANRLSALVASGLPVLRRDGGTTCEVNDWRETIFLPANGYGRISVDGRAFTAFDTAAAHTS